MTGLVGLDLSYSAVETLPDSIGNLTGLRDLDLSLNNITVLPASLGSMSGLQSLYLDMSGLNSLPDTIGGLVNLKTLYAPRNHFTTLPAAIGALPALTTVDLYDNELAGNVTGVVRDWMTHGVSSVALGSNGCLTITDADVVAWIESIDPSWNDGCPQI